MEEYALVIHPELSLQEFQDSNIPLLNSDFSEETGFTVTWFSGTLDEFKADFCIFFRYQRLHLLSFTSQETRRRQLLADKEMEKAKKNGHSIWIRSINHWGALLGEAEKKQKENNDAWLQKVIGNPPPYEYPWGTICSLIDDRQDGDAVIRVEFKYSFLERL